MGEENKLMKEFKNVSEAYWWVYNHPWLQCDYEQPTIEITPHMVNPTDNAIDTDNPELNTKLEFWVEVMIPTSTFDDFFNIVVPWHNMDLDCGGDTYEEAVYNLAKLVYEIYGDYDE